MTLIAASLTAPALAAGTAALVLLLVATLMLIIGLVFVTVSVRRSVKAVDYEVDNSLRLGSTKPRDP